MNLVNLRMMIENPQYVQALVLLRLNLYQSLNSMLFYLHLL